MFDYNVAQTKDGYNLFNAILGSLGFNLLCVLSRKKAEMTFFSGSIMLDYSSQRHHQPLDFVSGAFPLITNLFEEF